jgi:lipopolysaccharide biosynthesis glycosyltransferase
MERFKPPFFADYVLMLDADVLAVDRFDELFTPHQPVSAVMAHGSPFAERHAAGWESLYRDYQLGSPVFDHEHSGWRSMIFDEAVRLSPPYFNTGVVFGSAASFEALHAPYMLALQFVRDRLDTYFFEQIALTLAAASTHLPLAVIPPRYNYPNQIEFDRIQPRELLDVRLLHFLRTDIVSRERDFVSVAAMRALAARYDLRGSNEMLRQRVAAVLEHFTS